MFNETNIEALKRTCEKIISLTNEHVNGDLMLSQKMLLGDNIKEFIKNPIVETSGLLNGKE